MPVPFSVFGPGALWVTRTDIANATPTNIGFCQEFSIEFSGKDKKLFGQNQFPIDDARGTVEPSGKFKAAVFSALAWNTVFFGETLSTGTAKIANKEAGTIPAPSGPYTVTVANSANFAVDLDVRFVATGLQLQKVASAPSAGQYSVSAGVYTFAAADTGLAVAISYRYTVSGSGQKMTVTNRAIGYQPAFRLDYSTTRNNKELVIVCNECRGNKTSIKFALEDFAMPEFEIGLIADASDNVATFYYPEVS
jgi:hypothetical protein